MGSSAKNKLIPRDNIVFGKVRCNLVANKVKVEKKQFFPPDEDAPVHLGFNPYEFVNFIIINKIKIYHIKKTRKCLLCELEIKLDYKNARLLQQFVSSFSGRVYERRKRIIFIKGLFE